MFTIEEYTIEKLNDPTGLLTGDIYEYKLFIHVDEEDELYTENGVYVRVIFKIENDQKKISQASFHERVSDRYIDFELEEDEEELILQFCINNLPQDLE
ncbi:DUF6509 family protein [Bacillus pinisoli]|uniref:DUF6509 family protein n=1 Tax=Bacillus pinisoli TaxID=2901866 RepID=UPI001FF37AA8|nr:DUF6509 family protein [Bacillus pinisoli]